MTIALTGATGFVGQAVLDAAAREGTQVRALTRRPQPEMEGVTWVEGDLQNKEALRQLVAGSEAIVHVAGLTNTPNPAGFHEANVFGTRNVLRAAQDAGTARFVFTSSLSARESELSRYGASKYEAEKWVAASGLDYTIVRPPAVYGPRDKDMFELFRAARYGIIPVPPRGRISIIHVDDLAECLLALASARSLSFKIVEPDDGREGGYEHGDLARRIGRAMGRRIFAPHLPKTLLSIAAHGDRVLRKDKAKLTPDRVGYMVHPDWVCTPGLAVPKDIWSPRISATQGLDATADWYRANGWL